jgi:UDP-glucose 4-epimerase
MVPESVLVTGSSGTIGTELVSRLLDAGVDVTGVDSVSNRWSDRIDERTTTVDLCNPEAVRVLPTDVDMVIHLAANARVHRLVKDPSGAKENLDMTYNILEHARRSDIDQFVFASSREVYGNADKTIYREEDTFADACESPYTASKVGGEAMVDAYEQCYGVESCTLRFSNVYGKYDASDRVVPLFIAQAHRDHDLTVYGINKVLDFTHVDDCVGGVMRTVENFHKVSGMTLNIASGKGTSLVEFAEAVIDRVPTESALETEQNRTGEVSRFVSDISKAQKILDYAPAHTFESGLQEAIEWYGANSHLFDDILDEA